MKRNAKRYKEEQIIYALRQVEGGRKIAEVIRYVDRHRIKPSAVLQAVSIS